MTVKVGDKVSYCGNVWDVTQVGSANIKALLSHPTRPSRWAYIRDVLKLDEDTSTEYQKPPSMPTTAEPNVDEATTKVWDLETQLHLARQAQQAAFQAAEAAEEKAATLARLDSDGRLLEATATLLTGIRNMVNGTLPTTYRGSIYDRRDELQALAKTYGCKIVDLGSGTCSIVWA